MTMWDPTDLRAVGSAREVQIATMRSDASTRTPLSIWVVRVGDELFVRSQHGPDGSWFTPAVASTTRRLEPSDIP